MTTFPLWLRQTVYGELGTEALQHLGEWAIQFFQIAHIGIIIADTGGHILAYNHFLREQYQWDDGDLGQNLFDARPHLVEQGLLERFQAVVETGATVEFLSAHSHTRHGQSVYQNFWAYPLRVDGRTQAVLIQIEDVTRFVQASQELAQVKEYLDDIVQSSRDVILVLDDRGRITFANQAALERGNFRAEQLLGRRALSFIAPADRRMAAQAGRELARTGQAGYLETQLWLADSHRLDVGLSYTRLQSRPGVLVILRDIGTRKGLERLVYLRNRELAALGALASTLSYALDLDESLRQALKTLMDLMAADAGCICLLDEAGALRPGSCIGAADVSVQRLCRDPHWVHEVLRSATGAPVFAPETDHALRSVVLVPLVARGQAQGLLALGCRPPNAFAPESQSLLLAAGQQIGIAIENAHLVAQTQHQLQSMNRLFEASRVLTSTLDLDRVLELVIDAAIQSIPTAERGAVVLLDPEQKHLCLQAARGYANPTIHNLQFPRDQGYAGWALTHQQPIRIDDVQTDPRAHLNSNHAETQDIRSAIAAPLIARGEPIGVLDLACVSRPGAFGDGDLNVLTVFANQAAVAIENARLFAETQRRVTELNSLTQIGRAISAALDLSKLLELVYEQTSLVMDTTNFFIALYEAETDTVRFPLAVEGHAHVQDRPDFMPRQAGRGLTEHVIQTHAPLLLRRDVVECMRDSGMELVGPAALSWLGVPMMIGDRVLGVIAVQSYDREGAYTVEHLILLTTIAAQAAVAIENARLYAQAQRAEELAALNRISTLVTSSLEPQRVLDTIVSATVRVMRCQKAAIFIRDEQENDALRLMSAHGLGAEYARHMQRIPLTHERATSVRQGRVLAVEDLHTHPDLVSLYAQIQGEGFGALLDMPLRGRNYVLGCLTAYYAQPHEFSLQEIELLTTLANHAAVAIENSRLYASTDERLRERVTELVTLQQLSLHLTSSLDPATVLDAITEAALRLVEASDIHIFFYDDQTDEFTFGAGLWDTGERHRMVSQPRRDGITARTVREGRPIVINDAERHPIYASPEAQTWGVKAIASLPLKRADRILGVFNVAFLYPHRFSEDELRVLGLLADQAAVAIENARLYAEAQRLSITDGLTGLYNSRHFYAILKKEMSRTNRYEQALSLVMIDIDNFKLYNDSHGHLAGDDLLQDLARLLQSQIRDSDGAFRYGGEEFALLLPNTNKLAAAQMAERIRATVAAYEFVVRETQTCSHITVSMGVAMYPADARDERSFVHAADMALYAAKAAGKNRVRVHDLDWPDDPAR